MATPVQARKISDNILRRVRSDMANVVRKLETEAVPQVMDEIGKHTVDFSVATHTFNNRTFNLEGSYSYVVLPPHSTKEFEFETIDGPGSFQLTNDDDYPVLVYGAGAHYAKFVELGHGFDVAIQTHIYLRNEGRKILGASLRGKRITG